MFACPADGSRSCLKHPGHLDGPSGIKATIDKAGRLVIPKQLRDALGSRPGEVEVYADGAGIRVEDPALAELEMQDGRLVIPRSGALEVSLELLS